MHCLLQNEIARVNYTYNLLLLHYAKGYRKMKNATSIYSKLWLLLLVINYARWYSKRPNKLDIGTQII